MIAEYIPVSRQSTVVGAITAASYAGAALAFAVSPYLANTYGYVCLHVQVLAYNLECGSAQPLRLPLSYYMPTRWQSDSYTCSEEGGYCISPLMNIHGSSSSSSSSSSSRQTKVT